MSADLWDDFDTATTTGTAPGLWDDFDKPAALAPRPAIPNSPLGTVRVGEFTPVAPDEVVAPDPAGFDLGDVLGSIADVAANPIGALQGVVAPVARGIAGADFGSALERGGAGAIAGALHSGGDFIDRTIQQANPLPAILEMAGVAVPDVMRDPLGVRAIADEALAVNREIGADRAAAVPARPDMADFIADPTAAFGVLGERAATMGAESAPLFAAALATRSPAAGSGLMGAVTGGQTYTDLRGQGVGARDAVEAAALTALAETAGEGVSLPRVMGRDGIAPAIAAEALQEAGVELAQTNIADQALGVQTPVAEQLLGALDAAAVGGLLGGAGYAAGNAPAVLGDLARSGAAVPARPPAPIAQPVATAIEDAEMPVDDASDLDAMVRNVLGDDVTETLGIEPEPVVDRLRAIFGADAPAPVLDAARLPPVIDSERLDSVLGDFSGVAPSAPANPTPATAGQAPAPQSAPAAAGADLKPARAIAAKSRKPAVKVDRGNKPMDLLRVIATNGGLNREAFRAQGVDPAEFTRRAGFNYIFRKKGGMSLSDLREFMQQEGYLARDTEFGPATVDDNDALDLFDRAFRGGEEVWSEDQAEAVAAYEAARREADEAFQAEWEAANAIEDDDPFAPDVGDSYRNDVAQLTEQAYDLGAADSDIIDATWEGDHLENLRQLIARLQDETDAQAEAGDRASGTGPRQEAESDEKYDRLLGIAEPRDDFALGAPEPAAEPARREVAPSQGAGLFGAPSSSDYVDAAKRAADARRNGEQGTGRTDMLSGDGELFAGDRPEQARVDAPQATAADRPMRQPTDDDGLESVEPAFYSALARSVEQARGAPKRGTAEQWKQWLDGAQRRGEFRQSERDWLGVDAWLDGRGATTREELTEFVRANEVQVQEVALGELPAEEYLSRQGYWVRGRDPDAQLMDEAGSEVPLVQASPEVLNAFAAVAEGIGTEGGGVKFATYQLPGGQNYRELLLGLPTQEPRGLNEIAEEMFGKRFSELEDDEANKVVTAERREKSAGNYRSSHFDQPNILAHVRFNERIDADGKRVLFIEEIQSDWHQAGRKRGYRDDALKARVDAKVERGEYITPEEYDAYNARVNDTVPDAPFKGTDEWAMLAFKRMVRHAAENGFDRIAWTTGEQQAERYDLSKQVRSVEYVDGQRLIVRDRNGAVIYNELTATEKIVDVIGEDPAERLLATTPRREDGFNMQRISGDGLKVGGEGMRAFYDKILPSAVNKWGKRFGGRVADLYLDPNNRATTSLPNTGIGNLAALGGAPVHAIDLTPAMRDAALAGQPLFNREPGTESPSTNTAFESLSQGEADAEMLGLRAAVSKVLGERGDDVIYLHGTAGLPGRLRRGIERRMEQRSGRGRTAALYDPVDQQVYLFTDVVTDPDRAVWNALHEFAGHHGLRTLLGDKLDPALEIALQNPTVQAVADAIAAERGIEAKTQRGRMLAAEEALAELAAAVRTAGYDEIASRYGVDVPEGIRAKVARAIENFVARLKRLLDDLFGRPVFTDEDVRALLENAWQAANGGATSATPAAIANPGAFDSESDSIRESVAESGARAEQRRNEAAGALPVERGAAGWNYESGEWEGRRGALSRARASLQDKMLAWRDVQDQIAAVRGAIPDAQNVYRLENLMHGRVKEGLDRIEEAQVEPLMKAMEAAKIDPAALEEYLYARHARERNAQIAEINPRMPDGGSGMTNTEADAILSAADKATMEPLAKKVDAITRATRRRMLQHGLITQEQHDAMEAQYTAYVPLRGKETGETEFAQGSGTAGRGLDTRAKPVREALGRGAGNRATDILGHVIADAQRSVIMAEKARVGRAVMRLVLANPNPVLWQVEPVQTERALDASGEVYDRVVQDWSDPSIVAVRLRGQLYKVQINSAPLAMALNNVGVDRLGAVTRAAGAINRYFSAVLTKYNPAFVPVNASRDALFGLIGMASEHGEAAALDAALHYPQAARAAFRQAVRKSGSGQWDTWAREFAEAGGKTGYVAMPSAEDLARKIGKGGLTGYSPTGMAKAARAIGDAVGSLNDAVENALRLSAYVTLRKRGKSVDAAAQYAKNLTVNFNRKGYDGSRLNAWFLFYNAAMQGAHRVTKLLRSPKAWGYIGGLAGVQVIAAMAAMGMEGDDGEPLWNKVPDHVKRRNIVIVTPDGGVLTIPMPYGLNVFTYMAGRTVGALLDKDDKASNRAGAIAGDLLSATAESFSPVPIGEGGLGLLPTVLRIPVNVQTNRNDFGHQIRREAPFSKYDVPRASMGRPDTLEVFKLIATGMNRIGGGDEYTPPQLSWFDVAPEDVEYLLGELTGGAGSFVVDVATWTQKATGELPMKPSDRPIIKRFATAIDEQASQNALFYERRDVIARSLDQVRDTFEQVGAEQAEAMLAAMPELTGAGFRRRKRDSEKGPAGSVIEVDGRPQIVVVDESAVFGRYKAAEEAASVRNDNVRGAFARTPSSLLPNAESRQRDNLIHTANAQRQHAQFQFNSAWTRDVVGAAE